MDFLKNLFTKNTSYNPNNPSSNRYVPFGGGETFNAASFMTPSTTNSSKLKIGQAPTITAPVITPTAQVQQAVPTITKPAATTTPQVNPTIPNLGLAERNNNPGNLRFIGQNGAQQGDGGFAKFADPTSGFNALVGDLKSKMTGATSTGLTGNSTLQDLIGIYAPKGDGNDPVGYAQFVSQQLGVPINTPIGTLDPVKLATAIAHKEDIGYANKLAGTGLFTSMGGGNGTGTPDLTSPEGLAKAAAAAGVSLDDFMKLVQGNSALGSADYKAIYNDLGIPGLVDKTFNNPAPNLQALYMDNYNSLGLGDIKTKVGDIDKKIISRRQALQGAISDTTGDAWTSGATKDARIARDKEIAASDIQNLLTERESLVGQYDTGVSEIEKRLSNSTSMFNTQNTLDANKLNFLLNLAEKQAGLVTADNTKKTYRYAGTYLTEKRTADQQKADEALQREIKKNQATNGIGNFDKLNAISTAKPSVLPYAKVATALYNDLGTSNDGKNTALSNITKSLDSGDTSTARSILTSAAAGKLTGDTRSKFEARAQTVNLALNIKERLQKYVERTGDTNLITGNFQNIMQKLGTSGDPEAVGINSDMAALLQEMRANVTGAAWGLQEDAEYNKQAPDLTNTSKLNIAMLDGLVNRLNLRQKSAINTYLGLNDSEFNSVFGSAYNAQGGSAATPTSAKDKLDFLMGGTSSGGASGGVPSQYTPTLDALWNGQ